MCERVGDLHALGPGDGALARLFRRKPVQLAKEDQLVDDLHLLVEAALFGQIADAVQALALKGLAEETHPARVGNGDAHHHANGAGFAGAVGPQQAKHLARIDGEAQVVDGNLVLVGLGDSRELDNWHDSPADFLLQIGQGQPKGERAKRRSVAKARGTRAPRFLRNGSWTVTRMWVGKRSIYALFERRGSVKQIQQEHSSED